MKTSSSRVLAVKSPGRGLVQRPDGLWEFRAETIDQHIDAYLSIDKTAESTRWGMAAIAASVETKYGESRVEEFAEKVRCTPRHVRRMARVYRAANENGHWCPDLSFKHHIEALAHPDPSEALKVARVEGLSSIGLAKWIKEHTKSEDETPRERFSERHQSEGEQLIEVLREQVDRFPRFAEELNACIERVTARAERTRKSDRQCVIYALQEWGALNVKELMDETKLSHWDLRQVLADLIKQGKVLETRPPINGIPPNARPYVYRLKD